MGRVSWTFLLGAMISVPALGNTPPAAPVITEPGHDGKIVNPADVHMETGPFADSDPGDTHACSDWEIWTVSPPQRVWQTSCIAGVERVHTHLGDGTFEGSHAGRSSLLHDTEYRLQTRHRDSSGDPATEWSPWSQRFFHTAPPTSVLPMILHDVGDSPDPEWLDSVGEPIVLPAGGVPPRLRVESGAGELLLQLSGFNGLTNLATNPASLPAHVAVRVRIEAGSTGGLVLPGSTLRFHDDHGQEYTVHLPALSLEPGAAAYYWVSANGSTFVGDADQTEPDFSTLAQGAPVPWTFRQPGYRVDVVAAGFQLPVDIAFVPNPGPAPGDPLYYVAELYGTIKVVRRSGVVSDYVTGLLNFNPTGNFPGSGEQGLAGICVDPASGDLFATLLYDSASSPGTHFPKVIRLHSNDGGITASSTTTVLDMPNEPQGQSHQISNISIGPDGHLYVHMGDGFDASRAQQLTSFRGKILRMTLAGEPVPDNPFYNPGDGITARDYVYAYGVRNPFGGAWRSLDTALYMVENGPSVDRFAKIVAGRNYLWNGSDASMANYAIYNWSPSTAPVNIVFINPDVFDGSGFPAAKYNRAYITESGPTYATGPVANAKRITEFVVDPAGGLVSGPTPLIEYTGTGKGTAVALAAGPDGLYFSDFYKDQGYTSPIDAGANILRIRYVGTASFTAGPTTGDPPLGVQFTDTSTVAGASAWLWNFGDGTTSTQQHPGKVYRAPGLYDVTLRVTGTGGVFIAQSKRLIRVGTFPKIALIGGSASPNPSDAGIAEHLRGLGFTVDYFDDEPAARPSPATMAATYQLIVVSSTITSANVGGDFAHLPVPLVYWESAMNAPLREPLAAAGTTAGGATQITIAAQPHPITAGFSPGPVTVYSAPSVMSVALPNIGPGVQQLATRTGSGDVVLMAAESGAALINARIAPARRVFLFNEDNSWPVMTAAGRRLLEQAVLWAMGLPTALCAADLDQDRDVDGADLDHLLACLGGADVPPLAGCTAADLDGDNDVDQGDFGRLQRCISGPGLIADPVCEE